MRFLLLLLVPALLLAAACGGDDDDSGATTSATARASASPTATRTSAPSGSDVPTDSPAPSPTAAETPVPTPTATRRDVVADHYATNTGDVLTLLGGAVPTTVECPYDATDAVVDCSAQGYGRIAIDLTPTGEITLCRALLVGDDSHLVGVNCSTTDPATWYYKLVE